MVFPGKDPQKKDNTFVQTSETHKQIQEEMWMLQKALPYLFDEGEKSYNNAREAIVFIKDIVITHFEWEERNVFPVALVIGDLKIKQIVRDLQKQHIDAMARFDVIRDLALKHGFSFPDENTKSKFVDTMKEMIEIVLQNARLEDEALYPFLKEKKPDLTFKAQ